MRWKPLLVALLATTFVATACAPSENWDDPKWIAYAMKHNHPKSFSAYMALDDEQRLELLPEVIAAYDANKYQKESLRAMLTVNDSRTVDTYKNALERADDKLSLLGARGLVQEKANGSTDLIAERLKTVTDEQSFLGFMESIEEAPTSKAVEVAATIAQRPAAKVGGADTVAAACRIMRNARNLNEDVVQGIALGLVNFTAQPYNDPMQECQITAIQHAQEVIPALIDIYSGKNDRANDLVKQQGFSDAVARMRAAQVLGRIRDHKANDAIRAWLKADHPVPQSELQSMTLEEQQNWYDNHGQLFEISATALGYERNSADRELLNNLVTADGKYLQNYRAWFKLSEGAEMGLRQSAANALISLGDEAGTKKLLWAEAKDGHIGRGSQQTDTLYHLNVLHAIGRIAQKGDIATFKTVFKAQPERWYHEFRSLYGYFAIAEACGDDMQCRYKLILDPKPILEGADVKAWIADEKEERRDALQESLKGAIRAGGVWQIAMLGQDAKASTLLMDVLDNGPETGQTAAVEALWYCKKWDSSLSQRLQKWIDKKNESPDKRAWKEIIKSLEALKEVSKI